MCGIAGAIGASLFNSVLSAAGASAQEQAAYEAQLEQNEIAILQNNEENRIKNNQAVMNYEQLAGKELEVKEQAAAEKGKVAREADKRRAKARVAASWNGSSSATVDRLMAEVFGLEASDKATIESNKNSQLRSIEAERVATQMNSEPTKLFLTQPTPPSGLSLLTGVAKGVTGAFSTYKNKV